MIWMTGILHRHATLWITYTLLHIAYTCTNPTTGSALISEPRENITMLPLFSMSLLSQLYLLLSIKICIHICAKFLLDQAFQAVAPRLWISLWGLKTLEDSTDSFEMQMKTFLNRQVFNKCVVLYCIALHRYIYFLCFNVKCFGILICINKCTFLLEHNDW